MFEALFDRQLRPDASFSEALKHAGYDAANPQAKYLTSVWVACLEVARHRRFETLEPVDAYRKLGFLFTEGFMMTLVGRLVGVALPMMRPLSFVNRLGRYFTMGRSGEDIRYEVVEASPGHAFVEIRNPAAVPGAFVAGMIDYAFSKMEVTWDIKVNQKTAIHYSLDITWSSRRADGAM